MTNGDRTLTCRDCRQEFVFSASEQDFFSQRGFTDPVRCQPCRRAHKSARAQEQNGSRELPPRHEAHGSGTAPRGGHPAAAPHNDHRAAVHPERPFRGAPGAPERPARDRNEEGRPHRNGGFPPPTGREEGFPLPALDVRRFDAAGEARPPREGARHRRDEEPARDLYEENDGWGRSGRPRGRRERERERAYSEDW